MSSRRSIFSSSSYSSTRPQSVMSPVISTTSGRGFSAITASMARSAIMLVSTTRQAGCPRGRTWRSVSWAISMRGGSIRRRQLQRGFLDIGTHDRIRLLLRRDDRLLGLLLAGEHGLQLVLDRFAHRDRLEGGEPRLGVGELIDGDLGVGVPPQELDHLGNLIGRHVGGEIAGGATPPSGLLRRGEPFDQRPAGP